MSASEGQNESGESKKAARCIAVTSRGVRTSQDLAELLSAVMSDVADGSINTGRASVLCVAAGKMLKNAELEQRFGVSSNGATRAVRYVDRERIEHVPEVATDPEAEAPKADATPPR